MIQQKKVWKKLQHPGEMHCNMKVLLQKLDCVQWTLVTASFNLWKQYTSNCAAQPKSL